MCYRCQVCRGIVPDGMKKLTQPIHRRVSALVSAVDRNGRPIREQGERLEIEREVPLCRECLNEVQAGLLRGMCERSALRRAAVRRGPVIRSEEFPGEAGVARFASPAAPAVHSSAAMPLMTVAAAPKTAAARRS